MRDRRCASLTIAVLPLLCSLPPPAAAQSEAAPPASARAAHLALIANFSARCPELKRADPEEEAVAVVVFRVGLTGLPTQASIRSSSHSESLDAAATSCVMKLRFQPATSPGSGEPVVSWQQIALRWLRPSNHAADSGITPTTASTSATAPTSALASTAPLAAAPAVPGAQAARAVDTRVDVRVCVDGSGRLAQPPAVMRSSGDAQFDAAALRIAQSGSGSYHATTGADPASASPCLPLILSIEEK
jgi:TonB family protein